MILGSGAGSNNFFQRAKISASTSIFYDLFLNNKIGHKIVSTMQCEPLDMKKTKIFMKHKMREIIKKYPHFGSRIVNHSWIQGELDYDKMVIVVDESRDQITEELINVPFPKDLPGWQVYITKDNCVMFICDHTYGDGSYIANVVRTLFDNDELNNLQSPSREKGKSLSFISRVILFFKTLYLIYMRFKFARKAPSAPWCEEKNGQVELATFSLSELKKIRDRFYCSDGTHISINDIAERVNGKIRGWINYYGKFCGSHFRKKVINLIALGLERWATRKYKSLKRRRKRARHWLAEIRKREPGLFSHWIGAITKDGTTGAV